MSSTLVTTDAGSAAAGSEGVSEGATGNPRQGQANPIPLPANPLPRSLQYVTVYSNGKKGGFAGSEPVATARELPLRLQQVAGRAEQSRILRATREGRRHVDSLRSRAAPLADRAARRSRCVALALRADARRPAP